MNAGGITAESCTETERENLIRVSEERKQFSNCFRPIRLLCFASQKILKWIFDSDSPTQSRWREKNGIVSPWWLAAWLSIQFLVTSAVSTCAKCVVAWKLVVSECKQSQEAFEANSNNSQDIRLNSSEQSHEDDKNGVKRKALEAKKFSFSRFCYVTAPRSVDFFNDFLILILTQTEAWIVVQHGFLMSSGSVKVKQQNVSFFNSMNCQREQKFLIWKFWARQRE